MAFFIKALEGLRTNHIYTPSAVQKGFGQILSTDRDVLTKVGTLAIVHTAHSSDLYRLMVVVGHIIQHKAFVKT